MQQHTASFFAHTEASTGGELPWFVKDEFDAFLECGILAHGFRRLHELPRGIVDIHLLQLDIGIVLRLHLGDDVLPELEGLSPALDNAVHVEGSGGITVIDTAEVQFSSMDTMKEGRPVCLLGVMLHILTQGATFNLHTRLAIAGAGRGNTRPQEFEQLPHDGAFTGSVQPALRWHHGNRRKNLHMTARDKRERASRSIFRNQNNGLEFLKRLGAIIA